MGEGITGKMGEIPYEEYYTNNLADREPFEEAMERLKRLGDAETAAIVVRKHRDKLLEATDFRMTLDRIGLKAPTYTLDGLITFTKSIVSALSSNWAVYRQSLRDVPSQQGFPFDVKWPEAPKED